MKRVLIANRGEIACRVIRSCRALGIGTVAVYSDADREAMHVALADQAEHIGPSAARESYLVVSKLLAAAGRAGADAVHPGYGFLSENARFAEAVEAAGLVWIGPTPASIGDMGDKERARTLAEASGVPVLPGSPRLRKDDTGRLSEHGERVGYPLLVKAAAGGGGIGMRRVNSAGELAAAVAATQAMAEKAFGDGTVYLERYIPRARHVEIQVFGMGDGRAVHLYERDCSTQRRFQKIIEESPAPGLPGSVRAGMAAAAVALAAHQRYRGAGTIEFVVDADTLDYYFLEMNTRIQVEHPVTEMLTGRDLVAMQIELARGRLGTLEQHAVECEGHAVECRIYAEMPEKNFLPSPGTLTTFELPTAGEGVRVDTGFRPGDTITPFYDPMIAKLVCHGRSRDAALDRMAAALASTRIEGLKSNVAFLRRVVDHRAFRAGKVHTGFVDEHKTALIG